MMKVYESEARMGIVLGWLRAFVAGSPQLSLVPGSVIKLTCRNQAQQTQAIVNALLGQLCGDPTTPGHTQKEAGVVALDIQ